MRLLLATIAAFGVSQALAQDKPWDCDAWADLPQQGMNYCSYQDWQKADRALNALWPQMKNWAKVTDENTREWQPQFAIAEESLMKAQRAWIDYRDGHCESEGMQFAGGSMQPLIVNSCKASMTRKRTEELLLLLEEG